MKKFISSLFLLFALLVAGSNVAEAQWQACPYSGPSSVQHHTNRNDTIFVRNATRMRDTFYIAIKDFHCATCLNGGPRVRSIVDTMAPPHHYFHHWMVADRHNTGLAPVSVNCGQVYWQGNDRIYTAVFVPENMTITVTAANPAHCATVTYTKLVPFDDTATIRVTPNFGYRFSHWLQDGDTNNPRLLTHVNDNATYTAVFKRDSFDIAATVTPRSGLIDGIVIGEGRYAYLDTATLTALDTTPNYRFKQWSDGVNDNPRRVQVLGNASYTALFEHDTIEISDTVCFSAASYTWEGITQPLNNTTVTSDPATIVLQKSFLSRRTLLANDSVRRLTLVVYKGKEHTDLQAGDSCARYTWRGHAYTASGTYYDTVRSVVGGVCDSVYKISLVVRQDSIATHSETACDSYTWQRWKTTKPLADTVITDGGTYVNDYTTVDGCTGRETLVLTINRNTNTPYYEDRCDSCQWMGNVYTASGIYTSTYNTLQGCPSVDTLYLTIRHSGDTAITKTVCDSYTWLDTAKALNATYTTTGLYTYRYTSAEGCPSIDTLNLTVKYSSDSTHTYDVCDTMTWTVAMGGNGTLYDTTTLDSLRIANAVGCDSIVRLNLTVRYSSSLTIDTTVCNSFVWRDSYRNIDSVFTVSTTNYMFNVVNDARCTSYYDLTVTVNNSTSSVTTNDVCDKYRWQNPAIGLDTTYTVSGVYIYAYNTPAPANCPSADTLRLTIRKSSVHDTLIRYACDALVWEGHTYTTAGYYEFTHTATSAVGCDSIEHITLRGINHTSDSLYTVTACVSYVWHDSTYTATATPSTPATIKDTVAYTNDEGCVSVDTLLLTILALDPQTPVTKVGDGQFVWLGTDTPAGDDSTYYHSGHYGHVNTANCQIDSIDLTINYTVKATTTSSTCDTAVHIAFSGTGSIIDANTVKVAENDTVTIKVNRIKVLGWQFDRWNDGDTNNPRTVVVTSDLNLVASFTDIYHTVTVVSADTVKGTTDGSGSYRFGYSARIRAFANPGYHFLRWNDYSTANPRLVNVADTDYYFTAYFAPDSHLVTAVSADPVTGSVTPASASVATGDGLTLNAIPATGYHFTRWNDSVTTNPRTVYPTNDAQYTAYFDMDTANDTLDVCKSWNGHMLLVGDTVIIDTNASHTLATTYLLHVSQYADYTVDDTVCGDLPYTYTTTTGRAVTLTAELNTFVDTVPVTADTVCDSIKHYTVSVKQNSVSEQWDTVCEQYTVNGINITVSGDTAIVIPNAAGCDSTITLHLQVDTMTVVNPVVQQCEQTVWNGFTFLSDTVINRLLPAEPGNVCPVSENTHIIVHQPSRGTVFDTVCAGDSYIFKVTKRVWSDTSYEVRERRNHDVNGCDSIYTVTLKVNRTWSVKDTQTACNIYELGGLSLNTSGDYPLFHNTDRNGCDSMVTLHLIIESNPERIENAKGCEQYTWHGRSYSSNRRETIEDTIHTPAVGTVCDSVIRLRLTIYQKPETSVYGDVCVGQSYSGYGFTFGYGDLSTIGSHQFARTRGYDAATTCDSLYNINITVHGNERTEIRDTACDSYTWDANGVTYTTPGSREVRKYTSYGCDSTVVLQLVIKHATSATMDVVVCGYNPVEWRDGTVYTTDATIFDTIAAANGCDSLLTVYLQFKPTYSDTVMVPVRCDSVYCMELDSTFTHSIDIQRNYPTVFDCDSMVTYQIRVNHKTQTPYSDTIGADEFPYTFRGREFSGPVSNVPIVVPGDSVVCDSIIMLSLVIRSEGIDGVRVLPEVSLYPNPTNGILHIDGGEVLHVDVLDIVGRQVASYDRANMIDLGRLAAGSYTLRITLPEGVAVRKVVKR